MKKGLLYLTVLVLILLPACGSFGTPSPTHVPTLTPASMPTLTSRPTNTATPMPPTSTTVNDCISGECAPVGDLPGWRQIFVDEFAGAVKLGEWSECTTKPLVCNGLSEPYRSKWWAYTEGWPDTSGNGIYSPSKTLSVSQGVLDIYIHTDEEHDIHRVAAPMPLINGADGPIGQLYGRYAIRFKADSIPGYKIAWLLWPDSDMQLRDGEIDFPEGRLDGKISAFVHRRNAATGYDQDAFSSGVFVSSGWHTAIIDWTEDSVQFILDDRILGKSTNRIPNTAMHWVIQTETNLDGYKPDDTVAGHIQIDWVAVYALW